MSGLDWAGWAGQHWATTVNRTKYRVFPTDMVEALLGFIRELGRRYDGNADLDLVESADLWWEQTRPSLRSD